MNKSQNFALIRILGFKSEINDVMGTLKEINDVVAVSEDCIIQLLDADGLAGKKHVLHATIHAINAFKRKNNIANDLGMEICVRASAQRQISRAIEILGIKKGKNEICAVMVGCSAKIEDKLNSIFERDDDVLDADESSLIQIYNIKKEELELMGEVRYILMERTSLLILDA